MSMLDEIREQPSVFETALKRNAADVAAITSGVTPQDFNYALIAARGTSDNAARYAKYLWASHNGLPVALAAPSLFTAYQSPPSLSGALVVGISQSGESPDLIAVLAEGRKQGRPTMAITNKPDSPLAAQADFVLDIEAGEEHAVAATKTYSAQLLAVAMLSDFWRIGEVSPDLARSPELLTDTLQSESLIADVAKDFADLRSCAVLGRGYNHSTAFEWALKLQEVTYALAHPYSTADFRHGPVAVVEPGFSLMAAAPDGPLFGDMLALLEDVSQQRHARTVTISNRGEALEASRYGIPLPASTPEWISPMPIIAAAQLFTYHLGTIKGLDTENPRGLSKVTKTT
jgi:glucosamine--fructose-6-phosphate aminotransferase (isomerizing)